MKMHNTPSYKLHSTKIIFYGKVVQEKRLISEVIAIYKCTEWFDYNERLLFDNITLFRFIWISF